METFEINKICRCCLSGNGQMKPLFGFSLDKMLGALIGEKCILQLSRAFRFKLQCQKSNDTILGFIKTAPSHGKNLTTIEEDHSYCEESEDAISNLAHEGNDSFEIKTLNKENCISIEKPLESITPVAAKSEPVEFNCGTCNKVFNSRKQLVRHLKTHESNTTHKCTVCSKTFSQSYNLKKHMLTHNSESNTCFVSQHLCTVCGKSFKYASSLSKHNKLHTRKNLLYCSSCPKVFLENTTLQNHLRCHTGDRPFICDHCNKSFTNSSNLKKHIRSHSNQRPFKCNTCGQTFVERNYLTIHMKTHDSEKNALCSECGKFLANFKSLNAHMQTHTNQRKYRCGFENCDKSFSRPDTAAIHRRIHTNEKKLLL